MKGAPRPEDRRRLRWLAPVVLVAACVQASGGGEAGPASDIGPRTVEMEESAYAEILHVSVETGSDEAGDGSAESPWKTIGHALLQIEGSPARRVALRVAAGIYAEPTLALEEKVDLYGGFEPSGWVRDIAAHATILDGEGAHRIALGADDARVDGFILRNGTVQGKGGALLLEGVSPTVSNNVFLENATLAPDPWDPPIWHETANDGGAIACLNGCSAVIENNLFIRNRTEIGRGAGFACDNEAAREATAAPSVTGNVFLGNVASAGADTMRSGDGGAISFYGYCDGEIADNVVAENEAASRNDGGGIFVALWSAPAVVDNVIVGNVSGDDAGGLFLGGQKHHYGTPIDPVPPAEEFFVRVERNVFMGNRNGAPSSGAFRVTMMSRGVFLNNVSAENPGGVHTQRSELTLVHNTFAEDVLYEDDEGTAPGPTVYRNNIILGERNWAAPVTEEGTCSGGPRFLEDRFTVIAQEASYDPAAHVTRVRFEGPGHEPGALARRVVQAADRWGVVRSNGSGQIELWGDYAGLTTFEVQPSYHLREGSPCVDLGVTTEVDADMDGDPRPVGPATDAGADELAGAASGNGL
ncbi:MAG: right-handed parallel beta-helix repeat-containing protein [Gemmatimonadota bacterium]